MRKSPIRILAISGSLRNGSSNSALTEAAVLSAPEGMQIVRYHGLGDLPFFNPDLDREPLPPAVGELRTLVGVSDGVLICSPEYARGIAGAMKNALDWLVGSLEFPDKPVAVVNTSQRAVDADAQLRLTLRTMSAHLVESASITVPLLGQALDAQGILAKPELRHLVSGLLEDFRDAILNHRRL